MSEPHIYSFSGNSSDHVSVCPSVRLTGLNMWACAAKEARGRVVAHVQHNATGMIELYCSVMHAQCNATNLDTRGRRAQEGSEQHACRLKRDSEPDREDSGRDLVPEHWKDLRVQTKRAREGSEQHACRLQGNREKKAICCPLLETTLSQFCEQY